VQIRRTELGHVFHKHQRRKLLSDPQLTDRSQGESVVEIDPDAERHCSGNHWQIRVVSQRAQQFLNPQV